MNVVGVISVHLAWACNVAGVGGGLCVTDSVECLKIWGKRGQQGQAKDKVVLCCSLNFKEKRKTVFQLFIFYVYTFFQLSLNHLDVNSR